MTFPDNEKTLGILAQNETCVLLFGKTPVVGIKDRATNQVKMQGVERTDGATLNSFVHENTEPGATV